MRIHSIACVAILAAACSGELTERAATTDPGNVAATEAPYRKPPSYGSDPLLSPAPPKSAEPPPTGSDQAHSPTATPPGNPPLREEPGGHVPKGKAAPGTVYPRPMHREIRRSQPNGGAR
jgi:hypothetical protein